MVNFTLTIVRHGLTEANVKKVIQGQKDEPLNDVGRKQADVLGKYLKAQSITHAFASDLTRAKETLEIIIRNSSSSPVLLTIFDQRLRERKYGVLEGQPLSKMEELALKMNKAVIELTPEGGEMLEQLSGRVVSFFNDLCVALCRQFPLANVPAMSNSRNASRSCSLNAWLEENETLNNRNDEATFAEKVASMATFYLDAAPLTTSCSSSQDSGISIDPFSNVDDKSYQSDSTFRCPVSPGAVSMPSPTCETPSLGHPAFEWPPPSPGVVAQSNSPPVAAKIANGGSCLGSQHDRKVSMQSISSDDSNYPDIDAHILVVSHGGTIRELLRYMVDELGVQMPGGKGAALRGSPNTGFSTFFISADNANSSSPKDMSITCLNLHSKDHLYGVDLFPTVANNIPANDEQCA